MLDLSGVRVAILSYRLGMADGVSVTAAQWACALRRLGCVVRTVAGAGRPDVVIRGLAIDAPRPPGRSELAAALDELDPDSLSPREALESLYRLKRLAGERAR